MDNYDIIKNIFQRDINKKVVSIVKFENPIFSINNVYKIITEDNHYIFKIYHSAGYPENSKMIYISKKLVEHNIPHAKIYSYNRDDAELPNGYIIEECLPGITADRHILTEKEACNIYKKLAILTSKIHKIKFEKYGFIINGVPDCTTFTEHLKNNFIYGFNKMQGAYTDAELDKIKHILVKKLKPCDYIQPCLCHLDIQLKNIVIDGNNITLIDWDDARSFPAIVDIARLILLIELAYDNEYAEKIERAEIYKKEFFNNYESDDGFRVYIDIEAALHVWHGLIILNFYKGSYSKRNKIINIINEKIKLI